MPTRLLTSAVRASSVAVLAILTLLGATLIPQAVPAAAATPVYGLVVSSASNRSAAVPLDGASLADDRYIVLTPATGVASVTFWLDDRTMTSTPVRTERYAAFDFGATRSNGAAYPWNTRTVADGMHTISARAVTTAGTFTTTASFAVANTSVTPSSSPTRIPMSTPTPSVVPTPTPTPTPTADPAATPTSDPTSGPTPTPLVTPTPVPTAVPTPAPVVTPPPTPRPPSTSGPITVTAHDVTIDGVTISGATNGSGAGIRATGTAANPIRNLTIRNCTIRGFNVGILLYYVANVTIENCTISDAGYAGILIYSGVGGRITGNTIARIAVGRTNLTAPGVENNAYGIALSRIASTSFAADPRSSNFLVDGNLVTDVPLWHCYDTHAGDHITFSNNTGRRCPRGFFITVDGIGTHPQNITLSGNRLEQGVQISGGTNLTAVTLVNLNTGTISGNAISASYGAPYVYDYLGLDPRGSTNLTIAGQTVIP